VKFYGIIDAMQKNTIFWAVLAVSLAVVSGCGHEDETQSYEEGKAAFEANDFKTAMQYLEKSLSGTPTNVDAMVYMARTMMNFGDLVPARSWITKAQELAGGDSDVRMLAAQIAWHAKDYDAAEKGFLSIANDVKLPVTIRAEGWTGLGIVESTRNHHDQARIAFLRAIRLDRHHASSWYHLGLLYREAFGYTEAALEQLNIFVRLDETASPRVQRVLRKRIPELKEAISRAAAEQPGAAQRDSAASAAALAKADLAWSKGNFKTARLNYQEAQKQDPL